MPNEEVLIPANYEIPVRLLISVKPGKTFRYIETVQWHVSNPAVAVFDPNPQNILEGTVVARSEGETVLTVRTRIAVEGFEYSVEVNATVRATPALIDGRVREVPAYTVTLEWGTPRLRGEAPGAAGQQTS